MTKYMTKICKLVRMFPISKVDFHHLKSVWETFILCFEDSERIEGFILFSLIFSAVFCTFRRGSCFFPPVVSASKTIHSKQLWTDANHLINSRTQIHSAAGEMSEREEETGEGRKGGEKEKKRKKWKNGPIKHLLDLPICAKPSKRGPLREGGEGDRAGEREIERWWAKRKERRRRWRHGAHVNKCQELFRGENAS